MIDTIAKRRSIRKYTEKAVEEEKITELLKCAMNAPTAANRQEWHFSVITNKEILSRITNEVSPHMKMMRDAACAILVSGDTRLNPHHEYLCVDCAAAIENMLLAAVELGLGCCWCAVAPREEKIDGMRKVINLDENFYPVGIVAIGYPAEEKEPNNRFDPSKVDYIR